MTTFVLACVIFALLGFIGWLLYEQRAERERLINRLIAKTPSEVRVLDNEPRRTAPTPRPRIHDEDDTFWTEGGFEPVGI